ncbi:MotE family protein [Neobacillus ginsengisoli]|uniref:Flagellar motility protein MotE (MotC chaperone) n=1 Tax=Neobacillus ginsengisoli TaxID=904295 RepID=A0ABT9XVE3_9BACI|nr:hypothetical protein [Neobacillus ginsengisoli]MDQ0199549.1 flagellar motility protein MotE (MotC chaperone) [Neobacillus ginsengisoli]
MEEKQDRKLGSIFFWGIPIIFTVILVVIIVNFLDIPVWKTFQEWGSKVPVINQIIHAPEPVQTTSNDNQDVWKQQYLKIDAQLKEKDQKISELNKQLSSNQKDFDNFKKSNQEMQKQQDKKLSQEYQDRMKKIAAIYSNLDPSKAAVMIESMSLEDAALTFSQLDQNLQSNILGSMKDAKKAAQITMILSEIPALNETDPTSLKGQIHDLIQNQENPTQTLADTISGMPPAQSAGIIQSMMGTNSQVAMNVMKNISTGNRVQILTEIAKIDAKLAAQITTNLNN